VRRTVRSRLLVLAAASFVLVGFGGLPASAAAVADFTQSGLSGASANGQTFSGPSYEMKIGNAFTAGVSGSLQRIDLAVTSYTVYSAPCRSEGGSYGSPQHGAGEVKKRGARLGFPSRAFCVAAVEFAGCGAADMLSWDRLADVRSEITLPR
jgi:hypothetical protein